MSMPEFPVTDPALSREEVINQIISSIAMEELGLSHIINAEGEKLQYALGTLDGIPGPDAPLTVEELLKLNESVHNTLNSNMMNQFFLKEKLAKALTASVLTGPTGPTGAQGPIGPTGATGATGAPAGGAILTFGGSRGGLSTSPFIITMQTDGNGDPTNMVFYGFNGAYPITFSGPLADTVDLGPIFVEPLLIPRAGTIMSYSAKFIVGQEDLPINAGVHARIYRNDTPGTPGNNIFAFIPGTDFELVPRIINDLGGPPASPYGSVTVASDLNIPVNPGTRLFMVYYIESTQISTTGISEVIGSGGGAIAIS